MLCTGFPQGLPQKRSGSLGLWKVVMSCGFPLTRGLGGRVAAWPAEVPVQECGQG